MSAGVGGKQIPFSVRVSIVLRDLEIWTLEAGAGHRVLEERRGRAHDPNVIDAALGIGLENCATVCRSVVLSLEPCPWLRASDAGISRALAALGDVASPLFCIETQIDVLNPCRQAGGRPGTVQPVRDLPDASNNTGASLPPMTRSGHQQVLAVPVGVRLATPSSGGHMRTRW